MTAKPSVIVNISSVHLCTEARKTCKNIHKCTNFDKYHPLGNNQIFVHYFKARRKASSLPSLSKVGSGGAALKTGTSGSFGLVLLIAAQRSKH